MMINIVINHKAFGILLGLLTGTALWRKYAKKAQKSSEHKEA